MSCFHNSNRPTFVDARAGRCGLARADGPIVDPARPRLRLHSAERHMRAPKQHARGARSAFAERPGGRAQGWVAKSLESRVAQNAESRVGQNAESRVASRRVASWTFFFDFLLCGCVFVGDASVWHVQAYINFNISPPFRHSSTILMASLPVIS